MEILNIIEMVLSIAGIVALYFYIKSLHGRIDAIAKELDKVHRMVVENREDDLVQIEKLNDVNSQLQKEIEKRDSESHLRMEQFKNEISQHHKKVEELENNTKKLANREELIKLEKDSLAMEKKLEQLVYEEDDEIQTVDPEGQIPRRKRRRILV